MTWRPSARHETRKALILVLELKIKVNSPNRAFRLLFRLQTRPTACVWLLLVRHSCRLLRNSHKLQCIAACRLPSATVALDGFIIIIERACHILFCVAHRAQLSEVAAANKRPACTSLKWAAASKRTRRIECRPLG